jgi:hypothetical protein
MSDAEQGRSGGLQPVRRAKDLAVKAAGGWVEGAGDRAIQKAIDAGVTFVGVAAVTALLAVIKAHWPIVLAGGVAALAFFATMARLTRALLAHASSRHVEALASGELHGEAQELIAASKAIGERFESFQKELRETAEIQREILPRLAKDEEALEEHRRAIWGIKNVLSPLPPPDPDARIQNLARQCKENVLTIG